MFIKYRLICLWLLLVGLVIGIGNGVLIAQSDPTPTPFSPILVQSGSNLGQIQLRTVDDVLYDTGIVDWHNMGYRGAGQQIAVLDRGFGGMLEYEAQTGFTVAVARGADKAAYSENSIQHGTQVTEVLHEVAPDAGISVCEYADLTSFIRCIDWVLRADIHIVVHSAGVPALPLNGDGVWAREVNRAVNSNVIWVNAAGNFANGYVTDEFTDRNANKLHEFRGFTGEVEGLAVSSVAENATLGVAMLSWHSKDALAANNFDLDLQIISNHDGHIIAGSYNVQKGQLGQDPLEYVQFDMSQPFAIQIIDSSGNSSGVEFALFVEFVSLPGGESLGTIISPGDASGAITVGALQGFNVAPYSSRGPLQNGSFKPDLIAPDEIRLLDGSLFVGTSAAAPVVAGAVAVLWQANPIASAQDIRRELFTYTEQISAYSEINANSGRGRLLLPIPDDGTPQVTPSSTPPAVPTQAPTLNTSLNSTSLSINRLTQTDVCVSQGDTVTVEASGVIRVGQFVGTVGPDGTEIGFLGAALGDTYDLIPRYAHGMLICRIAGESSWQGCGSRFVFEASTSGCLEFNINDNDQLNNSGAFDVEITVSQ